MSTRPLQRTSKTSLTVITLLLVASGLAGCGKESAPAAPAAKAATAAPAAQAKSDALPAACEAYLQTVSVCVEKAGAGNPAAGAIKQQLDASRAEWAKVTDKSAFAASCKQMEDAFKATTAPALKC